MSTPAGGSGSGSGSGSTNNNNNLTDPFGGAFAGSTSTTPNPPQYHHHHHHHHHQYQHQQYQPQPSSYYHARLSHYPQSSTSSSGASGGNEVFTQEMRDRQARGKDPYLSGEDSEEEDDFDDNDDDDDSEMSYGDDGDGDDGMGTRLRMGAGRLEKEDYGKAERRQRAVAFLDNPELLMMYAQSTGETLQAARLHFMKMMCGFEDEPSQLTTGHVAGGSRGSLTPQRDVEKRGGSGSGGRTSR